MRGLLSRLIRPAELIDLTEPPPAPDRAEVRAQLRRLAAEALICSDRGESLIRQIHDRQGLGFVAPQAGPLVRRFFAMRDELPPRCPDPRDEQLRSRLDAIFHHHALLISLAMDLLAYDWRSERLSEQIDKLDGMGAPAIMLEEVFAELSAPLDAEGSEDSRGVSV